MFWYAVLVIVLVLLIFLFLTYNSFVKLDSKVQEAFSTMDVYLKKRWDLIPNLVKIVREYAKYEKETLEGIVELRNCSYDEMSTNDKVEFNNQLAYRMDRLIALSEAYPDLKANENFRDLSKQLTIVEDEIANARKYYNGTVRLYNNKIQMFPSNIVAMLFSYKLKMMFEADSFERKNIKIDI